MLVTDRHATLGRPLLDVVAAALSGIAAGGLAPAEVAVQLREKDLEGRALTELAWALRALTAEVGAQLYINDRADIALAVRADGVQLAGISLSAADVGRFAPELGIGVSAHRVGDVAGIHAGAASGRIGFAMFGPVNDTPSKRGFGAPVGLAALTEAARIGLPLIAIGGLGPADVAPALAAGASGVACIRAVMSAADPGATVAAFCKCLAHLRPPPGAEPASRT